MRSCLVFLWLELVWVFTKKIDLDLKKEFVSTIHIFEDKSSIFQQSMLNRSVKRRKTEFQAKLWENGTSGIKW